MGTAVKNGYQILRNTKKVQLNLQNEYHLNLEPNGGLLT